MLDPLNADTLWLNVTNIVLGLVTLVCFIAVVGGIIQELAGRARSRSEVLAHDDSHTFALADLGITMADGGEKIDETQLKPIAGQRGTDETNIHRSDN